MAITSSITYCGKYSFDFFGPALYNNDLFERLSQAEGIKNTLTLPAVDTANVVVGDSCDFADAATITMDPRTLTPCTWNYREQICLSDVEPLFISERLRDGANAPVGPDDFVNYLVDRVAKKIGNSMQSFFWGGTAGCDGIFNILGGTGGTSFQSGVVGVTAAAGVTAGNVMVELAKVYAAIPAAVKQSQNVTLFVTQDVMDAYLIYNASTTTAVFTSAEKVAPRYLNIPMVLINTSNTRRMVATDAKNLWVGTDLMSDMNEIRVVDMRDTTAENKIRLVARWRFGAQVAVLADTVYYA